MTEPIAYALCARVVLDSFPPTLAVYLSRGDRTRASEVDRMRTIVRTFVFFSSFWAFMFVCFNTYIYVCINIYVSYMFVLMYVFSFVIVYLFFPPIHPSILVQEVVLHGHEL